LLVAPDCVIYFDLIDVDDGIDVGVIIELGILVLVDVVVFVDVLDDVDVGVGITLFIIKFLLSPIKICVLLLFT
jgi:hypothetical protein